ncbi:pre-mRNA-splicing factor cwc22 homolog [Phtheirospermum japonicum]|uniref:Pre-mRNA-splicing factor cwc22 homolog n=1 Tax=Phtheirospermum japonicum TaxID=374723 RepID=A0A830C3J2_9LAMI|nr:pre-mRNA-splicing factor cwc22 homolog [Phtheirospermum japonicum]
MARSYETDSRISDDENPGIGHRHIERSGNRSDDESRRAEPSRTGDERGNHGNIWDSKLDRDSEDDRSWINSRRDDDGMVRERRSRHDDADNDDYRNGDRDYGVDDEIGRSDKIRVRNYLFNSEPESDRIDRSRRSKRGHEGYHYSQYDRRGLEREGERDAYIPPFKLARTMKDINDKSSLEYQRSTWDALKKSINGLMNRVNASNIKSIILELFAENLIRGKGTFCRCCMRSQMLSPQLTDVFAALVAVVNTKFPKIGNLLLRRILYELMRSHERNDKPRLLAGVKFIAHLLNQRVIHELIVLELLTLLLEKPTDDSIGAAVVFVTECGSFLQDLSTQGMHDVYERFRGIFHEGEIDERVKILIKDLFALRKANFQGYPAVRPELDLVDQEDQWTHEVSLTGEINPDIALDIFRPDPNFLKNEKRYKEVKRQILGEEFEEETDIDLVNLRKTMYLAITSSVDYEEAEQKLLRIKLEPGQEARSYIRQYGLLGQRLCMTNKVHRENFEKCFLEQYSMIHRLEAYQIGNVAKFFAHLLATDALPWHVLSYVRLTEEDTNSASRIFVKILFQELSEHLGICLLNEHLSDPAKSILPF